MLLKSDVITLKIISRAVHRLLFFNDRVFVYLFLLLILEIRLVMWVSKCILKERKILIFENSQYIRTSGKHIKFTILINFCILTILPIKIKNCLIFKKLQGLYLKITSSIIHAILKLS